MHLHGENQCLREQNLKLQDSVEGLAKAKELLTAERDEVKRNLNSLLSERKNLKEGTAEAEMYRLHAQSKIEKKQAELEDKLTELAGKEEELQR